MKAVKFSVAAAAALALSTAAMANPTVYGQIGAEFGMVGADGDLMARHNASRLGVKGSHDLGDGVSAVYQIELAVDPADKDYVANSATASRTSYAGFKGGFGTVMIGQLDHPSKMVSRAAGLVVASDTTATLVQENKRSLAGAYVLPIEGMTAAVAVSNVTQVVNGGTDAGELAIDAGVLVPMDALKIAVGLTQLPASAGDDMVIRAGATYNMGALTVGGQIEMAEDQMNILIPVNMKMESGLFISAGALIPGGDANDGKDPSIGVQIGKDFDKKAQAYVAVGQNNKTADETEAVVGMRIFF